MDIDIDLPLLAVGRNQEKQVERIILFKSCVMPIFIFNFVCIHTKARPLVPFWSTHEVLTCIDKWVTFVVSYFGVLVDTRIPPTLINHSPYFKGG